MKNKSKPLRGKIQQIGYIPAFTIENVESACKFYKYYHNDYDLFIKDYPKLVEGKMYLWLNSHNFDNEEDRYNEFNCFLFDYTFEDVIQSKFI